MSLTWAVIVLAAYALMSVVTLAVYWWDKRRARAGGWRVPEATLHVLALLGGWPGAIAGVMWLRHKSRKWSFLIVLVATLVLHAGVWAWWLTR